MPTCLSCKQEVAAVNDSGYCPRCASIAMKAQLSMHHQENEDKRIASVPEVLSDTTPVERVQLETVTPAGSDGYYEYKILDYRGRKDGAIDTTMLSREMNYLGREGWRLVSSISNYRGLTERGTQASKALVENLGQISQNVFVFERYVISASD